MKKLVAAVAFATAIASPALALNISRLPAQPAGEVPAQAWQDPAQDFAQVIDVRTHNRAYRSRAYRAYGSYRGRYRDPTPFIRDYLRFDPPLRGTE